MLSQALDHFIPVRWRSFKKRAAEIADLLLCGGIQIVDFARAVDSCEHAAGEMGDRPPREFGCREGAAARQLTEAGEVARPEGCRQRRVFVEAVTVQNGLQQQMAEKEAVVERGV